MEIPTHPGRHMFVNIPVDDLDASVEFFTKLGFTFNPLFTDETATCMLVGEQAYFMLLTKARFLEFATQRGIEDPVLRSDALYAFSVDTREDVDRIAELAAANGGALAGEPQDYGFMYSRGFDDPNGHHFDVLWMDPVAAEQGPEASLETANA